MLRNNNRFNVEPRTAISLAANVALGGLAAYQTVKKRRAQKAEARAEYEATHDSLTGVLNERGLEKLLESKSPPRAMLYVDGTNQKKVNDELGHDRGDEAIKMTADILQKNLRPGDVVARIGGDEFLVLLDTERRREHDELTPEQLLDPVTGRIAEETTHTLEQPENADLQQVGFNVAVGGTVWRQGMSVVDMRNASEQNMYGVKQTQHAANGGAYRP